MFRLRYLILCAGLLFICKHVEAQGPKNNRRRHDEMLRSYVFEPSDDYPAGELQADATTMYPPLVEHEANTVSFP